MYTLIDNRERFIVIAKDAGVDFHHARGSEGLARVLRDDLACPDLYPVHRLDKMTSGLLLFAKGRQAAGELSVMLRLHSIEKYYLALGGNRPRKKQGAVIGDMVNGRNGVWILSRTRENPTVTQFFSTGLGNGLRLYLLRPRTGRTHQLRVALKAMSAPVLGDPLYARGYYDTHEADRGYLHAYALRFSWQGADCRYRHLPTQGRWFADPAFQAAVSRYAEPWSLPWPARRPGHRGPHPLPAPAAV